MSITGETAPERCENKRRFRNLLDEALALADLLSLPPEIGARLQEVIDLTDNQRDKG